MYLYYCTVRLYCTTVLLYTMQLATCWSWMLCPCCVMDDVLLHLFFLLNDWSSLWCVVCGVLRKEVNSCVCVCVWMKGGGRPRGEQVGWFLGRILDAVLVVYSVG